MMNKILKLLGFKSFYLKIGNKVLINFNQKDEN